MKLTFLGATKTVTGSKFLLEFDQKKFLIDCGLFQGLKELRLRNWMPFPIAPSAIDGIILTHAHIDHSGYLPVLVKNGFAGKIYCSPATRDLCAVLLPDSGYLQEEEAKFANKKGYSKHCPPTPLYTRKDAERTLLQFCPLVFRKKYKISDETTVSLIPAGHILGASFVQIKHCNETLLFSGDLGRPNDPIMYPPAIMQEADYLVLESTYGDRLHHKIDPLIELEAIINKTITRGGTLIIPSFAVGRAQHLLYLIYLLRSTQRISTVPIYVDSPMATEATNIFRKYSELHRLDAGLSQKVCAMATYVATKQESQALDLDRTPKIIISASGMLEGGRVLHHLKTFGIDEHNTIVFTGYQAAGTRGADLSQGNRVLKIFGETITVNAEIKLLNNMSAHADYDEILQWLSNFNHHPKKIFITHGEPAAAMALKEKIEERFRWNCIIPDYLHTEIL
jgi:metallo-beta-lactamase family protein